MWSHNSYSYGTEQSHIRDLLSARSLIFCDWGCYDSRLSGTSIPRDLIFRKRVLL